jgi:hypothetical protein
MKKPPNLKVTAAVAIAAAAVFLGALFFPSGLTSPETDQTAIEEPTQEPKIDASAIAPEDLYTFECELTVQKPEQLTQTCADGGIYIYNIAWSTWSAYSSTGSGIYSRNLCEPDCASGSRVEAPVNLKLNGLMTYKNKTYLSDLEVTPTNPSKLPAELNPSGWDVSEFAVMMNWDVEE